MNKKFKILAPTPEDLEKAHKNYVKWMLENTNNFSYWYPKICLCKSEIVHIPESRVLQVPENIFENFFLESPEQIDVLSTWVQENVLPFIKDMEFPIFAKNGCFSNKFNFGISCFIPEFSFQQILHRLINIQSKSLLLGTGGNMELVFREFIKPEPGTSTIYSGMPLRPEMRVFYDFDSHKVLYCVDYWDWDYCASAIGQNSKEDREVYSGIYPELHRRVQERKNLFIHNIEESLGKVWELRGIWSVDFILEKDKVWLIDMASAQQSAYWNYNKNLL